MSNLLSVCDIKDEVLDILELAKNFKEGKMEEKPLAGKSLAMIFQKSSTRTRVSFDVGMYQLGGQALYSGYCKSFKSFCRWNNDTCY